MMQSGSQIKSFREYLSPKIMITLSGIAVAIVGSFILVPGLNWGEIRIVLNAPTEMPGKLFSFLTTGFLSKFSVTSLGIKPYLSASAIVMLLSGFIVTLRRWHDGNTHQMNLFKRVILTCTVLFAILQSVGMAVFMFALKSPITGEKFVMINSLSFYTLAIVCFTTGTLVCLWVAETITKHGLINGILVFAGFSYALPICVSLGRTSASIFNHSSQSNAGIIIVMLTVLFTGASLWLLKAARYFELVPINKSAEYASKEAIPLRFPMRLNYVGVVPYLLGAFFYPLSSKWFFFKDNPLWGLILYGFAVFFFSLLYNTIIVCPKNITEILQKYGYAIKGNSEQSRTLAMLENELLKSSLAMAGFLAVFFAIELSISKTGMDTPFTVNLFSIEIIALSAIVIEIIRRIDEEKALYRFSIGNVNNPVLTTVCDCETELEGDIIRDILSRNGIVSYKKSNRAVCLIGSLGIWEICRPTIPCFAVFRGLGAGGIELMVHQQELENAIKVLEQLNPGDQPPE